MKICAPCFLSFALFTQARCKPTFVLVPGAWHSPVHYSLLTSFLNAEGYDIVSQRLPGVDSPNPKNISVQTDADFIRSQEIMPLLNQGKEVVLIACSYGGSPGAAAAKGLSKAERKTTGKKGGLIGLIFIAALLAEEGLSLKQAVGGQFNDWVIVNVHNFPPLFRASF